MTRDITPAGSPATRAVDESFAEVRASFDRFCLAAGIEALETMMEADVTAACGPRHGRDAARRAHRWGRIGFHGGKIEVERPRVRGLDGREVTIPSWETAAQEDWLGRWVMRTLVDAPFGRANWPLEGDVPAPPGSGGFEVSGLAECSWRCRRRGWPTSWPPTCPRSTFWWSNRTAASRR